MSWSPKKTPAPIEVLVIDLGIGGEPTATEGNKAAVPSSNEIKPRLVNSASEGSEHSLQTQKKAKVNEKSHIPRDDPTGFHRAGYT